jgi:hypothetical protein
MKLTGPASWFFARRRPTSRPGNLSLTFGRSVFRGCVALSCFGYEEVEAMMEQPYPSPGLIPLAPHANSSSWRRRLFRVLSVSCRRIGLLCWLLVGTLLLLGFLLLFGTGTREEVPINRATYDRVRLGMTEKDLMAAVRLPAGYYSGACAYGTRLEATEGTLSSATGWDQQADGILRYSDPTSGFRGRGHWWMDREGLLAVMLGADGRVIERRFGSAIRKR